MIGVTSLDHLAQQKIGKRERSNQAQGERGVGTRRKPDGHRHSDGAERKEIEVEAA